MKSISKLKKELDKWFSLYIRLRDATDEGMVQCFTCGKVAHYKKGGMQCGHFQSRRYHSTRWNEQNCQVQCVRCNMFSGNGEQWKFGLALDVKYGEGTSGDLEFAAKIIAKKMRAEYEEDIRYYKSIVENLKKEKGIE
jgi:hypothetical protein